MSPKILVFAGSARKDSYNKKLVKIAMKGCEEGGADVTYIDLKEYPMPPYDGDLEEREGLPENAKKLKQLMIEHDGFLISSPEYNSSISGYFKNVLDWVSRPQPNEVYLVAYKGKTAAVMSASPSNLGGLRGLVHLRAMLQNIYVFVLPKQVTVPEADKAFNEDGSLKDPQKERAAVELGKELATVTSKLKSNGYFE